MYTYMHRALGSVSSTIENLKTVIYYIYVYVHIQRDRQTGSQYVALVLAGLELILDTYQVGIKFTELCLPLPS